MLHSGKHLTLGLSALMVNGRDSSVKEASTIAPVVLLHGIDDSCPQDDWVDMIQEAIDY